MPEPPRDELSDTEKAILECLALKACGEPEQAKRLVAVRIWARDRGWDGQRTILVPVSEVPPCSE
jgi:hypothetical protein